VTGANTPTLLCDCSVCSARIPEFGLQRRVRQGLQLIGAYTFGKTTDAGIQGLSDQFRPILPVSASVWRTRTEPSPGWMSRVWADCHGPLGAERLTSLTDARTKRKRCCPRSVFRARASELQPRI
jgi:hypothetical protein